MFFTCISLTIFSALTPFYVTAQGNESSSFICTSSPDEETMHEEEAVSPELEISVRSFLLNKDHQWRRGIIPYELSNDFTRYQKKVLLRSMKYFSSLSCVRWVPRMNHTDYVAISRAEKEDICRSAVGRTSGRQNLKLGDMCFNTTGGFQGAIEHEMMHTMGFIHEHQRLDRDCYVAVATTAIESSPFDYEMTPDTDIEFPYDVGSIMHYGTKKAFLEGLHGERLGNFKGRLTELDVMKLRNLYCKGPTYCELRPYDCRRLHKAQEKCVNVTSPTETQYFETSTKKSRFEQVKQHIRSWFSVGR